MDPTLLYGPFAALALLIYAVVHLYKENTELRKQSMDLLKKYQERDEEERRYRQEQERRRLEDQERRRSEART